ncbi:PaaI family thioesterase [Sneathiella litorea]|uniref:Hotdog fold thioesterase n=1 Tax=Sneathiella litorea TaxID=2606216 RepID=A0A6L8W6W2_9PROT|nr:PaaI family thioesterase [Sneathiella litorea]MZR30866.1 hotdog fold thioesterase [Sneathiella litorea]
MSEITIEEARKFFENSFSDWIKELDITITDISPGSATLRIPATKRINRLGGMICGQAIMALADTAMVFAVATNAGSFVSMTSVNMQTTFLRPAEGEEMFAVAKVIKSGKRLVYGEINLHMGDASKPVSHVTTSVMLL